MGWDEETAAYYRMKLEEEEDRRRREDAGITSPGGGTLVGPESGVQSFLNLLGGIGNYLGERGWGGTQPTPIEQRSNYIPPSPVQGSATPTEIPPPTERRETSYAPGGKIPMDRLWTEYLSPMGVNKLSITNPIDGSIININRKDPKPPQGQVGQVPRVSGPAGPAQPQGQPVPQQPVPQQPVLQPVLIGEPGVPNVNTTQAELDEMNRRQAKLFSPFYNAMNTPYTAKSFENKIMEEAARARNLSDQANIEGHPTQGKLLKEAYERDRMTTTPTQRFFRSFMRLDPYLGDTMAAQDAEYNRVRLEKIAAGYTHAIDIESAARISGIYKAMELQEKEQHKIATDLDQKLLVNPRLMENRDAAIEWVVATQGIPFESAGDYVDKHYNSVTKTYDVNMSLYRKRLIVAANGANMVQSILPDAPRSLAMAIGIDNPAAVISLAGDELNMLKAKLANHKGTPAELQGIQNRIKEVTHVMEYYARDHLYHMFIELKAQRESPDWEKSAPKTKQEWGKNLTDYYTTIRGIPSNLDPEKLFNDLRLQEAQLTHYRDQHLLDRTASEAAKKELPPKAKLIKAGFRDVVFKDAKNLDYDMGEFNKLKIMENLANDPKYDKEWDKANSKQLTPEQQTKMKQYQDYALSVLSEKDPTIRTQLGGLTRREAIAVMDNLETAHARGLVTSPKVEAARILAHRRK